MLALLCGVGGGTSRPAWPTSASSSPSERKGSALGERRPRATGVTVVQPLSPLVITPLALFGVLGGDAQILRNGEPLSSGRRTPPSSGCHGLRCHRRLVRHERHRRRGSQGRFAAGQRFRAKHNWLMWLYLGTPASSSALPLAFRGHDEGAVSGINPLAYAWWGPLGRFRDSTPRPCTSVGWPGSAAAVVTIWDLRRHGASDAVMRRRHAPEGPERLSTVPAFGLDRAFVGAASGGGCSCTTGMGRLDRLPHDPVVMVVASEAWAT